MASQHLFDGILAAEKKSQHFIKKAEQDGYIFESQFYKSGEVYILGNISTLVSSAPAVDFKWRT
jgi:hypothetical protein